MWGGGFVITVCQVLFSSVSVIFLLLGDCATIPLIYSFMVTSVYGVIMGFDGLCKRFKLDLIGKLTSNL